MNTFFAVMQIICAIFMCVFYGRAIYIWNKNKSNKENLEIFIKEQNKGMIQYIIGILFYVISNIFFILGQIWK